MPESKLDKVAIEEYLMPEIISLKMLFTRFNLYKSLQVLILLQSVLEAELKKFK